VKTPSAAEARRKRGGIGQISRIFSAHVTPPSPLGAGAGGGVDPRRAASQNLRLKKRRPGFVSGAAFFEN
jgi:hypothetical protein